MSDYYDDSDDYYDDGDDYSPNEVTYPTDKKSLALVRATGKGLQFHLGKCSGNDEEFLAYTDVLGLGIERTWNDDSENDMLKTALAKAKDSTAQLEKDMATMLESFVRKKMKLVEEKIVTEGLRLPVDLMALRRKNRGTALSNERMPFYPHQQPICYQQQTGIPISQPPGTSTGMTNTLPELHRFYCVFHGPPSTPDTFTLPRLSLTFPYETALIRMKHPAESLLPGQLGRLNKILAFPGAPLIIPVTWSTVFVAWRKWFISFLTHSAGHPFTGAQEKRLERFCDVLQSAGPTGERMMNLLGIEQLKAL